MSIEIPENIRGAIERYVEARIPPGSCTRAILENDLHGAVVAADAVTVAHLADIVQWCRWTLPSECWGSKAIVKAWLEGHE